MHQVLILQPLAEAKEYVDALRREYIQRYFADGFSTKSIDYLAFCITAILVTGTICWYKFGRASGGRRSATCFSWWLHHCKKMPWDKIFYASVSMVLRAFNVKECSLVIDDFDRHRAKSTKKLFGVHKTRNKKEGGFVQAQNIVLLVLVTNSITIPVGFAFYRPDPSMKAWAENDKRLRKNGIKKSNRPPKPGYSRDYPPKKGLAISLVHKFKYHFREIEVKSVSADSVYLSKYTRKLLASAYPKAQFVSQLRCNQIVICSHRGPLSLKDYFAAKVPRTIETLLRGGLKKRITYVGARVFIKSHNKILHVVALKYDDEANYRYLCANTLTWRSEDIIQAYSFRWLVEVVNQDFKLYDGWGKEASQQREDGASRSLCLGLLVDHFLLHHPRQQRLYRTGKPLHTAGSLRNQLQFENLMVSIETIIGSSDPKGELKKLAESFEVSAGYRSSRKHLSFYEMPDLKPSSSLSAKFKTAS